MTAVRFADYVAAGCIGPEPREWPDSADPWITERTHRRWCPLEHEFNAPSAVLINVQVFDKSMKIVTMCHDVS